MPSKILAPSSPNTAKCERGLTALAMLIQFYDPHRKTNPLLSELREQTLTPDREGAFPQDIISAARRQGFETINVNSLEEIDQNLEAGLPVMPAIYYI